MVDSNRLRQAWSMFPTGVTLVSTLDSKGDVHSMTANAVCSVSLEPPLALICVSQSRHSHRNIVERGSFSMSFLNQDQADIAQYFALDHEKRSGEISPEYKFSADGVPILKECDAYIICHVEAQHEAGDHSIFVARITEANVADLEDGEPLVFYQSRFTGLKDE